MKVLLCSSRHLPTPDTDLPLLLEALTARGLEARVVLWDDPTVRWDQADVCVVRSTWDYTSRLDEFLAWSESVSRVTRLFNAPSVFRWNCHKRYLKALAEQGVPIIPTTWGGKGETPDLAHWLSHSENTQGIIKPAIGAGSSGLIRFARDDLEKSKRDVERLASTNDWMMQPYLPSLVEHGESSCVFINGQFTHAVRKVPQGGDFRVQPQFGAAIVEETPTAEWLACASHAMASAVGLVGDCLYGRVDLVRGLDSKPTVIEVELIEPLLFLQQAPQQADGVAKAIASLS